MTREIAAPFLRDDDVGLERRNLLARLLDPILLNLQQRRPILLLRDLHVGLVFTLLVLEGAIQQQDSRSLDASLHATRSDDVLVHHHPSQHGAIVDGTARNLFHLCVLFNVDIVRPVFIFSRHAHHGVERQIRNQFPHARGKLGTNGTLDNFQHFVAIGDVDGKTNGVDHPERRVQRLHVRAHDHRRVNILLQKRLREV